MGVIVSIEEKYNSVYFASCEAAVSYSARHWSPYL